MYKSTSGTSKCILAPFGNLRRFVHAVVQATALLQQQKSLSKQFEQKNTDTKMPSSHDLCHTIYPGTGGASTFETHRWRRKGRWVMRRGSSRRSMVGARICQFLAWTWRWTDLLGWEGACTGRRRRGTQRGRQITTAETETKVSTQGNSLRDAIGRRCIYRSSRMASSGSYNQRVS